MRVILQNVSCVNSCGLPSAGKYQWSEALRVNGDYLFFMKRLCVFQIDIHGHQDLAFYQSFNRGISTRMVAWYSGYHWCLTVRRFLVQTCWLGISCVETAGSPCDCMGCLWEIWLSSTEERHASSTVDSESAIGINMAMNYSLSACVCLMMDWRQLHSVPCHSSEKLG